MMERKKDKETDIMKESNRLKSRKEKQKDRFRKKKERTKREKEKKRLSHFSNGASFEAQTQ